MGKIAETYDRFSGRVANSYAVWALLPSGAVSGSMAWLSTYVDAVNQFGAFGWASVGLTTFVTTSVGLAAVGTWREKLANAKAAREWNLRTDAINPLRRSFDSERIRISDLAHPLSKRIEGKSFNDCQLVGPANIILIGSGTFDGVSMLNCDVVIIKDSTSIFNVTVLENCHMMGGEILNSTFFMNKGTFDMIKDKIPGISSITYDPE